MKVEDLMTKEVIFVSPETKITEVAEILTKNRFHGIPVVKDEKVVGIITEGDFFSKEFQDIYLPTYVGILMQKGGSCTIQDKNEDLKKMLALEAKDIMTPSLIAVSPFMEMGRLLEIFQKTNFVTFPVTDKNNALVGVITLSDVIKLFRV